MLQKNIVSSMDRLPNKRVDTDKTGREDTADTHKNY